jgi:2-hydroxycyclohexanecarboxyl-CoA dehydrogenase
VENLNGEVAIVTGGNRGIGRAIVEELAKCGAAVSIVDRSPENEAFSKELNNKGYRTIAVQGDVTKTEDVKRAVETTQNELGAINILVNNAGWDQIERFIESDEKDWIKVIDINLLGQMRFCREVVPSMIERNYGRIINISSDAGRVGTSGQVAYSAAKGGVIAFTKGLAREVVRFGITVNCVAPGPTNTPLFKEVQDSSPKLYEALIKAIPMRRAGESEEVAYFVSMLVSKNAGYMTGQTLSVSGGLTMI